MSKGGIGREIFEMPLIDCIKNHVNTQWEKTHFLSFTEDINRAIFFGRGKENFNKEYVECYEDDDSWDFALFNLAADSLLDVVEVENGIFSAQFVPSLNEFKPKYKIVLIM